MTALRWFLLIDTLVVLAVVAWLWLSSDRSPVPELDPYELTSHTPEEERMIQWVDLVGDLHSIEYSTKGSFGALATSYETLEEEKILKLSLADTLHCLSLDEPKDSVIAALDQHLATFCRAGLMRRWGQLQPQEAVAYALTMIRPRLIGDIVADSEEAADLCSVYHGWARVAPQEAMASWTEEHESLPEHKHVPGEGVQLFDVVVEAIFAGWSHRSSSECWQHLAAKLDEMSDAAINGCFSGLQKDAPWAEIASTFQDHHHLARAAGSLADNWAFYDPEEALNWLVKEGNPEALLPKLKRWYRFDMDGTGAPWLKANWSGLSHPVRAHALRVALEIAAQAHPPLEEVD